MANDLFPTLAFVSGIAAACAIVIFAPSRTTPPPEQAGIERASPAASQKTMDTLIHSHLELCERDYPLDGTRKAQELRAQCLYGIEVLDQCDPRLDQEALKSLGVATNCPPQEAPR